MRAKFGEFLLMLRPSKLSIVMAKKKNDDRNNSDLSAVPAWVLINTFNWCCDVFDVHLILTNQRQPEMLAIVGAL